jgi:hypothetical protein
LPDEVFNDLNNFIAKYYDNKVPNTLLVAQKFILEYPEYGKKFGLSEINKAIEHGLEKGLFKLVDLEDLMDNLKQSSK